MIEREIRWLHELSKGSRFVSPLKKGDVFWGTADVWWRMIYGIHIRMYAHTFYNILFRIPFNSILWSSAYTVSLTQSVVWQGGERYFSPSNHLLVSLSRRIWSPEVQGRYARKIGKNTGIDPKKQDCTIVNHSPYHGVSSSTEEKNIWNFTEDTGRDKKKEEHDYATVT